MKVLMLGTLVKAVVEDDTTDVALYWSTGLLHIYHGVVDAPQIVADEFFDETSIAEFETMTLGTLEKHEVAEVFGITRERLQQLQDECWVEIGP
jgi:hypothetical protein